MQMYLCLYVYIVELEFFLSTFSCLSEVGWLDQRPRPERGNKEAESEMKECVGQL